MRIISIQTLLFEAFLPTRQYGIENRDKTFSVFVRLARLFWPLDFKLNIGLVDW